MEISKAEAEIILYLVNAAWEDGQAIDNDAFLLKRIIEAFPDLEVPSNIKFLLERALKECSPYKSSGYID